MHVGFAVTLKGTNVRKTKWLQCFLILRENKEDSAAPHNEKLLKWKTIVLSTQSVKFQTIALWAHKVTPVTHVLTTLSFAREKATICCWSTTLGLPERIIHMATSDGCSNTATSACAYYVVFNRHCTAKHTWIKSTNVHGSKESRWPMSLANRLRILPEMKRKKPFREQNCFQNTAQYLTIL